MKSCGETGLKPSLKCQSNGVHAYGPIELMQWPVTVDPSERDTWPVQRPQPSSGWRTRAEILYECNETPLISCDQRHWPTSKVSLVLNYSDSQLHCLWSHRRPGVEKVRRVTGLFFSRRYLSTCPSTLFMRAKQNNEKIQAQSIAQRPKTLAYICALSSGAV